LTKTARSPQRWPAPAQVLFQKTPSTYPRSKGALSKPSFEVKYPKSAKAAVKTTSLGELFTE
jgi:hypothetical protein